MNTLLFLLGCGGTAIDPPTLAEVSETVQFASVDTLGPHHYLATVRRTDAYGSDAPSSTVETTDIRWQDWDDFQVRRLVDGQVASNIIVAAGQAFLHRRGGGWARKDDAEPYRVQLRTTWNAWDAGLELFLGRIELAEQGQELIEGRPVRRFIVSLKPAPEGRGEQGPQALAGSVWIDAATAVRLKADVDGTWKRGDRTRTVSLQLSRAAIGQPQDIHRPIRKHPHKQPTKPGGSPARSQSPESAEVTP